MRDVIWTIIIIWGVYRLYNAFFSGSKRTVVYEKHEHHHYAEEGKVKVETTTPPKKPRKIDDIEYTDFEEIK